ncbi:MAG TPA: DUF3043 domain-containing protein [Pseudonocardiaceae bacterium]|nr:DUF3043 domain-containing protein [Pseudonocardiaceae bacterium]
MGSTDQTVGGRVATPAKGRPTPKRREAESRRRGPVPPPPRTQREAYKRARGSRADRGDRRRDAAVRRERMAAGDDKYLLPRDKGPVRAFVRNTVDSRRHLVGLFMPLALLVLVAMLMPSPAIQVYAAPVAMAALLVMVIEGIVMGRGIIRQVRLRFPDAKDGGLSLGWYAFVRASQVRKLRMPKPQVKPGDTV